MPISPLSLFTAIKNRLPSALVGGRLDVNVGNTPAVAPDAPAAVSGTITSNSSTITATVQGYGSATVELDGTYAGVQATFEVSNDNSHWYEIAGKRKTLSSQETPTTAATLESRTGSLSSNTTRAWEFTVAGYTHFRVRATNYTSGTANVRIIYTAGVRDVLLAAQILNTVAVSGTITDGGPGLTLKSAGFQSAAGAGDFQIVAGVTSKKITVYAYHVVAELDTFFYFESNTTAIPTGVAGVKAINGVPHALALNPPNFFFQTAAGEALQINNSEAVQLSGWVSYWEA